MLVLAEIITDSVAELVHVCTAAPKAKEGPGQVGCVQELPWHLQVASFRVFYPRNYETRHGSLRQRRDGRKPNTDARVPE